MYQNVTKCIKIKMVSKMYSSKQDKSVVHSRMSLKTFFTNFIKSYLCTGSKCFSSLLGVLTVVVHILVIPVAVRADHGGQLTR